MYSDEIFFFLLKSNDASQKCPLLIEQISSASVCMANRPRRGPAIQSQGKCHLSIGNKCNQSSINPQNSKIIMNKGAWNRCCYTSKHEGFDYLHLKNALCGSNLNFQDKVLFKVIDYELFKIE